METKQQINSAVEGIFEKYEDPFRVYAWNGWRWAVAIAGPMAGAAWQNFKHQAGGTYCARSTSWQQPIVEPYDLSTTTMEEIYEAAEWKAAAEHALSTIEPIKLDDLGFQQPAIATIVMPSHSQFEQRRCIPVGLPA